jgi:hypothetical protein
MGLQLEVLNGERQGQRFPLDLGSPLQIGRSSDCTVYLPELFVSRRHAEVGLEGGRVWARDLGSRNGLWVRCSRLPRGGPPCLLEPGDILGVASVRLRLVESGPMTEGQWLVSRQPSLMLEFILPDVGRHKLTQFGAACGRRFARDRSASTWSSVSGEAGEGLWDLSAWLDSSPASPATLAMTRGRALDIVRILEPAWGGDLLRELFGNPFRPLGVDPVWFRAAGGAVPRLAQAIDAEEAFDRLPILADALEEAGCDDADVLAHCRTPGEHVRGCWVVDLLLGRS